jgi:septum site-determining protein MinC
LTSANPVQSRQSIRFRGRSFVAFVLAPMPPVDGWLHELDRWSRTSPNFFANRPTILDVSSLPRDEKEIAGLIATLGERGIRILGLEAGEGADFGPALPPVIKGGRPAGGGGTADAPGQPSADADSNRRNEPSSLLVETPIRSGQSVVFPYGDITVLGAVSSGAEVVAGGSIHVYGALRGRAMAGAMGNNGKARVFASRNEAELIAIDGYYLTAEDMAPELRGRSVQCWLNDRVLQIAGLD